MTTGTRATAVVTTDGRTPRPDGPRTRSRERSTESLPAPPSAGERRAGRHPRSRPAHARRTANPMYDRPSDRHATEVEPPAQLAVADPTAPGVAQGGEDREHARARRQPRHLHDVHPMAIEDRPELVGRDEHRPLVDRRVHDARQPPLLHGLDGEHLAPPRAVDRVEEVEPAGPEHPRRLGDDPVEVAHVLEHVAAGREVECGIRERQLLTRTDQVRDVEAVLTRVGAGRLDGHPRRVDARHGESGGRELLGDEAGAAPDVQRPAADRRPGDRGSRGSTPCVPACSCRGACSAGCPRPTSPRRAGRRPRCRSACGPARPAYTSLAPRAL